VGQIIYPADVAGDEAMFEGALEAGADNVESDENGHEVTTAVEDFNAVREAMESQFGAPEEAGLTWKPQNTTPINEDQAQTFMKLMDALDDLDDVQSVSSNVDIPEDVMAKMNG
jgi:transcriptional/translational regulatory protein YebC/TACO1